MGSNESRIAPMLQTSTLYEIAEVTGWRISQFASATSLSIRFPFSPTGLILTIYQSSLWCSPKTLWNKCEMGNQCSHEQLGPYKKKYLQDHLLRCSNPTWSFCLLGCSRWKDHWFPMFTWTARTLQTNNICRTTVYCGLILHEVFVFCVAVGEKTIDFPSSHVLHSRLC